MAWYQVKKVGFSNAEHDKYQYLRDQLINWNYAFSIPFYWNKRPDRSKNVKLTRKRDNYKQKDKKNNSSLQKMR